MAEFFYYAFERKVPIELVEDHLAVGLNEPISQRRLEELRASDQMVDILGSSPILIEKQILIYRLKQAGDESRLNEFVDRLLRGPTVRFVMNVFRDAAQGLYLILADEILVRFKANTAQTQVEAIRQQFNIQTIEQKLYAPNQHLMRVFDPSPRRTLDVANALNEHPAVDWASPNFLRETYLKQTPALFARQWHLKNTGQGYAGGVLANGTVFPPLAGGEPGEDVKAEPTWQITQGSGNVAIAILDTGVDVEHPDLKPNIAPNGRNFDDPSDPTNPNPSPPTNPANDDGSDAHGTSCAGVAAAAGVQMSGVAPKCKILPIKMLSADDNGMADSIHYAAQHAPILSNSWGDPPNAPVDQALLDVISAGREGKGTVVLFAVGNDGQAIPVGDQSRVAGVIAVGASTNIGSRAAYSNIGDSVDNPPAQKRISVLAPSDSTSANARFYMSPPNPFPADGGTDNIYTTDIRAQPGWNPQKPGLLSVPEPAPVATNFDYTGLFGGTSSACPLVAGVCGLMLSVNANLTAAQVKYILEATADKIGTGPRVPASNKANYDANGHDPGYGFGRVHAERAVKAARGEPLPQMVFNGVTPERFANAIPIKLVRDPGTNHFVSEAVIELVDARRDPNRPPAAGKVSVRGGPGGFLRATFQPTGGGPAMTDEVDIQGQPT